MYSFPDLEPVCCFMYSSNCCFLTYIQFSQKAGQVVWYSHLFKNFPQFVVIHIVKGFSIVNEAEIGVFLEFSWFFDNLVDVGNLTSGLSAFYKSSLCIWKSSVHILLKANLKDFEQYLARMWNECNHTIVGTFFGIALLWDWNENWPFPVIKSDQIRSDQSLSHVQLFATPWIAACQASLSITKSLSSPKLMFIESVMPSSHHILCCPLLLLPPNPPSISLFQWVNSSHEVAKVLEFQL